MKRILINTLYVVIALVLGLLLLGPSDETQEPQKIASQMDFSSEKQEPQKIASQLNFPALTGRVVDQAGVLGQAAKGKLEAMLATHENNTTNQVVVVTIKSLGNAQIEEYSLELARHWGIGQKGKDNGVVLAVAPNDRRVRIEVGYGLEGTITDSFCEAIIDNYIVPEFKKGDIEGGIKIGTQKILALLEGDEAVKKDIEKLSEFPVEGYVMLFGALLIFVRNMFGIIGQVCAIIGVSAFVGGAISLWAAPRLGIEDFAARGGITAALSAILLGLALRNILAKDKENFSEEGIEDNEYEGPDGDDGDSKGFKGGGGSFGGGGASGKW